MREFKSTEMHELAELSASFFEEESGVVKSLDESTEELNRLLSEGFNVQVVDSSGCIAAFCIYRFEKERIFVKRLYTRTSYRKQGLASAFLTGLKQYHQPVYMYVAPDNEAAMRCYKKLGAKECFRVYEIPIE